ncbi:membrane fusion protein, Cu(I)/Ag(I) efflux system [Rhizobiales bacterium GAS113]|nr:membrane fusion protein, Cu(I)/Ag(I) efflux system [Rhizobiales bacterium GAS113]
MTRKITLAVLVIAAVGSGYWAGTHRPALDPYIAKIVSLLPQGIVPTAFTSAAAKPAMGAVIYYRDPDGRPFYSSVPKTTDAGKDFIAVRASEDVSFDDSSEQESAEAKIAAQPAGAAQPGKRIRFYRNPMGLPDTSPAPKKDSMGMDYIPVYDGDNEDGSVVKVSPGKLQRTGVRSEPVAMRSFSTLVRAPATIQLDERRQSVVALRFEAYIDKVEDVTTGMSVRQGQPLMRLYGPDLAAAAAQYISVLGSGGNAVQSVENGARRRLENLGVPDSVIAEITRTRQLPLTLIWPAPRSGVVLERNVVDGMRAAPGDTLFRVADTSVMWALADIAESDLPAIAVGQSATIRPRGRSGQMFKGRIAIIYPTINKATRTARIRIELANADGLLMPDMYADVEIATGSDKPVLAVPESSVLDSGDRQVVIVDKGEGRFEPREVQLGQRGGGFVAIRKGIQDGDKVVVSANFLIDAESNLKAALQGLANSGETK